MPESQSLNPDRSASSRFFALLIAALVGGVLAGVAVLQLGSYFTYPPELAAQLVSINAELNPQEIDEMDREFLVKNTTLCGAVSGMLLAGLLGLGAGLRSFRGALAGLGTGVILGGLFGALGGYAGATTWQYLVDENYFANQSNDTAVHAVVASSVVWAAIGLAAGAAAGFDGSLRKRASGAMAGLFSGVVAAGCFLIVAAIAFPKARIGLPIPENLENTATTIARMVWAVLPAILIGIVAAIATAPDAELPPEQGAGSEDA